MPDAHSKYSASGFEAATLCPGKRVMERGKPDSSSKYADEGTAAHSLLADCLTGDDSAASHIGAVIPVNGKEWVVTTEMAAAVQTAIDNIKEMVGDGMLLSEQRVNYASYLSVPKDQAWGTSDIIAARDSELQVHDYKHGMGVEVNAEDNPQMKLYGLGALDAVNDTLGPFETVRLVIHQPRIKSAPSEWVISVADLEAWGRGAARQSVTTQFNAEAIGNLPDGTSSKTWQAGFLNPNEKSCKFCRAKSTCPALRDAVAETVFETKPADPSEFDKLDVASAPKHDDATWLAKVLAKADLIEDYLKAVRAEVERRLLLGTPIPGYKLVRGKRGNRAWGNPEEVEAALKAMRLKTEEMYDLKLISPTSAEKLTAGEAPVIGPRQWIKVKALITQADGKPHVAPTSDKRPALDIRPVASEFVDVSTPSTEESYA